MQKLAVISIALAFVACAQDDQPGSPSTVTPTDSTPAAPASPVAMGAAGSSAGDSRTPAVTPGSMAANPTPGSTPANPTPAVTPPAATPGATPPAAGQPNTPGAANPTSSGKMLAMDECDLNTKFAGDEYCIDPPPAAKGFQLHVGPSNYDNVESKYLLQPGEENVVNLTAVSGNDKEVQYYYRQYRMRPGSHHVILTANGQRIGGTQNLARDNPVNGIIPPENQGVGLTLPARVNINANMHYYNFTDKPIIRDLWVNYWYKEPGTVTDTAKGVFSMTGVTAAVARSHVVVGASCQVTGSGHILSLSGHRHMSNVRFSVWHKRGGTKNLLMEDFDPDHPASFEYNSLTTNPMPNQATKTAGAASGVINLKAGDTLDFECEIINNTDKNFVGLNEAADDEMCILTGDTVGASVSARCSAIPARRITGGAPAAD